jgi:hypothetical protein
MDVLRGNTTLRRKRRRRGVARISATPNNRLAMTIRSRHHTRLHATTAPGRLTLTCAAAFALGLAGATLQLGGCVESAIAAAGVTAGMSLAQDQATSFIRGELKAARMAPIEDARRAVHAAMSELHLVVLTEREGEHDGYIRGKADGGREIKIFLKADSAVMTRFTVRVGFMGDAAVSKLVMARIDRALGTGDPHDAPGAVVGFETIDDG